MENLTKSVCEAWNNMDNVLISDALSLLRILKRQEVGLAQLNVMFSDLQTVQ